MNIKSVKKTSSGGFTLIELLIVILIIGILAGVLIAIIDPAHQRKVAGDATLRATLSKLSLVSDGFISSYGHVANEASFFGAIDAVKSEHANSCQTGGFPDYECYFQITSTSAPSFCSDDDWRGSETAGDSNQCYFRYYAGADLPENNGSSRDGQYRIYVKSYGLADSIIVYDNAEGGRFFHCPYTIDDSEVLSTVCEEA
jgi:prepilin-type N-terminal cleavage/methylation domain-containing protein